MKQIVLKAWDLPGMTVTALVIFVVCFLIYTWWTFRKQNRAAFEEAAHLPLEDAPTISSKRNV